MLLRISQAKKRCDSLNCKNEGVFRVKSRSFIKPGFYFCEECLKKMFKDYMATYVPKGIESPFKPNQRIKKERK